MRDPMTIKGSWIRNHTAKAIREARQACGCSRCEEDELEDTEQTKAGVRIAWCILLATVLFIGGCILGKPAHASEIPYTDNQIVNAIYLAEGGKHAQFAYGIRSIHYKDEASARKLCQNTVRNNRKRFKEYGYRQYPSFIQFLGSRYCPVTGGHLSASEKRLNKNWVSNIQYFLKKGA